MQGMRSALVHITVLKDAITNTHTHMLVTLWSHVHMDVFHTQLETKHACTTGSPFKCILIISISHSLIILSFYF